MYVVTLISTYCISDAESAEEAETMANTLYDQRLDPDSLTVQVETRDEEAQS